MQDDIVQVRILGKDLIEVIENGLRSYPKMDGGFPCISGFRFKFDSSKEVGNRVVELTVNGHKINKCKLYTLVTKEYLYKGKDGFTSLPRAELMTDSENVPTLDTLVTNFFKLITTLNTKWFSVEKHRVKEALKMMGNTNEECLRLDEEGQDLKYKYFKVFPKVDGRVVDICSQ